MKKLIKKPIFVIGLIIVCIVLGISFFGGRSKSPAYEIVIAKKGEVIQEVSVTGQVESEEKAGRRNP